MDYSNLLTYQSPTGQAFFWSGSIPNPQCTLGSTKVECPHRTTQAEADRLVDSLCKAYPGSIFCLKGKCPTALSSSQPKVGMVVSPEGHGIGIVTTAGDIRSLPTPIPHPMPSIAHETGTVPIVQVIERSDQGQLAAQVSTGLSVGTLPPNPPPPPPPGAPPVLLPVNVKPIKPATAKQQSDLLRAIEKGAELKAVGLVQKCDVGFYWSQKLGKCVAISGTSNQQIQIADALRKKFQTLPSSQASVSTVSTPSEEW